MTEGSGEERFAGGMAGPEQWLGKWGRKGEMRRDAEGELIELGDRKLREIRI